MRLVHNFDVVSNVILVIYFYFHIEIVTHFAVIRFISSNISMATGFRQWNDDFVVEHQQKCVSININGEFENSKGK